MKRRRAREYALQMLFQGEYIEGEPDTTQFWNNQGDEIEQDVKDFTNMLVRGAFKYRQDIDLQIEGCMENWTLQRLAAVDRAALRVAAYEILYCADIPHAVSINEALEIVKKFSTIESASFLNGILDKLARKKR